MRRTSHPSACLLVLLLATCLTLSPAALAQSTGAGKLSLYKRLGGQIGIATVVDDFVDRLLEDSVINANPAFAEIKERVRVPGLKFLLTLQICEAAGGPERYTGRKMKEVHKGMGIGEPEWRAMLAQFGKSLDSFNVPAKERAELVKIVESTKKDIIEVHTAPSPRSVGSASSKKPNVIVVRGNKIQSIGDRKIAQDSPTAIPSAAANGTPGTGAAKP